MVYVLICIHGRVCEQERKTLLQGLSQVLETGCPKLTCKIFGCPIFQGGPQYTQITTIVMYLLVEIRHYVHMQCHGNNNEVRKKSSICLKWTF